MSTAICYMQFYILFVPFNIKTDVISCPQEVQVLKLKLPEQAKQPIHNYS